jgi:glycosyltransferase involved in cell wall biosynthesis
MASPRSTAAPPHTGTRIDRIGVVVPVNNEEHGLRQCLAALDEAASHVAVPVTVIVVLDSCTDDSAAVVDGFSGGRVESLIAKSNNVGVARAAGMAVLLHRHPASGTWLATTDGDSIVPRHWFAAQVVMRPRVRESWLGPSPSRIGGSAAAGCGRGLGGTTGLARTAMFMAPTCLSLLMPTVRRADSTLLAPTKTSASWMPSAPTANR